MSFSDVFSKALCGFLALILATETTLLSCAYAGHNHRLYSINDLEERQYSDDETQTSQQHPQYDRAGARARARILLQETLFKDLPEGEPAEQEFLRRQRALFAILEKEPHEVTHAVFTQIGESLAGLLHHDKRVQYLVSQLSPARKPQNTSPYRKQARTLYAEENGGAKIDHRAVQITNTAVLQTLQIKEQPSYWKILKSQFSRWRKHLAVGVGALAFIGAIHGAPRFIDQSSRAISLGVVYTTQQRLHSWRFGHALGDYAADWEEVINQSPQDSQQLLRNALTANQDYVRLLELEQTMVRLYDHEQNVYNWDYFHNRSASSIRAEAETLHFNLIRHMSGQLLSAAMPAVLHEHSEETITGVTGRSAALLLFFFLLSTAGLALVKRSDIKLKHLLDNSRERDLNMLLASGYKNGCNAVGIEPDQNIINALESGRFSFILDHMVNPADSASCETLLASVGVLTRDFETQPVRLRVPNEQLDEDHEPLAVQNRPTARQRR